jgi:hypothetical protein
MEKSIHTSLKTAIKHNNKINSVLLIASAHEKCFMRICLLDKNKYTQELENIHIEIPINTIQLNGYTNNKPLKFEEVKRVCFHESFYSYYGHNSHLLTILQAIRENSTIDLKIIAFNGNQNYENVNFVNHAAFLTIDNKNYMFSKYVGFDNLASPVQY